MDACLATNSYVDTANYEPERMREIRVQVAVGLQ